MSQTTPERSSAFVQSLGRGLSVLEAFSTARPNMSLTEVARETGLTRATARRLLLTLEELGYVRRTRVGFELGARVMNLGYNYLASQDRWLAGRPAVERLVARTQESSSIAVLDRLESVYILRVPTTRIMTISLTVGARLPAFSTSTGRVLLAALPREEQQVLLRQWEPKRYTPKTLVKPEEVLTELERVRTDGYSLVDQEIELGVNSLAVPLLDRDGDVLAALNVSAHASRIAAKDLERRFLGPLRDTAAEVNAMVSSR